MARGREENYASFKPSEAEEGGQLGFPDGAEVTITDQKWTTWEEAGEKAITRGREADDPALMITGEVEGVDDPVTVFLGAGKAARLQPSRDGERLVIPEGSSAKAINKQCNAFIFLNSLTDKKRQGKKALSENLADEGITAMLGGLKFIAGYEVIKRDFQNQDEGDNRRAARPSLIAAEIVEGPSSGGKKSSSKSEKTSTKAKGRQAEEDEDEEEETPKKKASGKGASKASSNGHDEDAEAAIVSALESPKFRKGLPVDKAYAAVFAVVRDKENRKDIMALVEDEDWLKDYARPWITDDDVLRPA